MLPYHSLFGYISISKVIDEHKWTKDKKYEDESVLSWLLYRIR
jgi:predicted nucleic acid-binding protein